LSSSSNQTLDRFSLRPVGLVALFCFASSTLNAVFTNSHELLEAILMLAGFLLVVFLTVLALVRKRWKRAASIGLSIPAVMFVAALLGSAGIDRYQISFWVTYPYYQQKMPSQQVTSFDWNEGGVFLGGGWQNKLKYDPADEDWMKLSAKLPATLNALSLGEINDLRNSTPNNCDMRILRQLGGHWYLDTEFYGGGFICE
jgi:hypothetical protein